MKILEKPFNKSIKVQQVAAEDRLREHLTGEEEKPALHVDSGLSVCTSANA